MSEKETVELFWTGKNNGPIPVKTPTGSTYRVSVVRSTIPVKPEDVDYLLNYMDGIGGFRRVSSDPDVTKPLPDNLKEPTIPAKATEVPQEAETVTVDTSTIAALEMALDGPVTLDGLQSALDAENTKEKPRKGIVERLENAIADIGNPGNL